MLFILNPKWRMRKEKGYILFYGMNDEIGAVERKAIDPVKAIILSLFNGKNTFEDVYNIYSYIFNVNYNKAQAVVDSVFNEFRQYFVEFNPYYHYITYNPEDFIIPLEEIDLTIGRLSAPVSFIFLLTNKCYTNCIYCYAEKAPVKQEDLLAKERIHSLLDEAKSIGVINITLSGGDPLAYEGIFDLLKKIKENNIYPFLSTKKYIDEETAIKLKDSGIEKIQLSIDTLNDFVAEKIVGVPNYATHMIQSIKNLNRVNIKVQINSVITSVNKDYVKDLIYGLSQYDIEILRITPYGKSIYRNDDSYFLTKNDCDRISEIIEEYKNKCNKIKIKFSGFTNYNNKTLEEYMKRSKCTAGYESFVIHPEGSVTLCEEMPRKPEFIVGNIKKNTLMDIWNSDEIIKQLIPPRDKFIGTACYDCFEFFICHAGLGRCFRNSLKAYGTAYAPAPGCPYAPEEVRI